MVDFASNWVDVDSILAKRGYDRSILTDPTPAACGILAFVSYKLLSPLRLAADSVMVPLLVRRLRFLGVMEPERPVDDQSVERAISKIELFDERYNIDRIVDLDPAVRVIRRRVQASKERRDIHLRKYEETQRKIEKVLKRKRDQRSNHEPKS